jgi:hypothetical protein
MRCPDIQSPAVSSSELRDVCQVEPTRRQTYPAQAQQCFRYGGHRPAVRLRAFANVAQKRLKALRRVGAGEPVDIKQRFAKWEIHFVAT